EASGVRGWPFFRRRPTTRASGVWDRPRPSRQPLSTWPFRSPVFGPALPPPGFPPQITSLPTTGSPSVEGGRRRHGAGSHPFSLRFISQVCPQPAFHFLDRHPLSGGVAFHLIACDEIDREIARLGMAEVETADGRRGPHRIALR